MGIICGSIVWCFFGLNQTRSTHDLDSSFHVLHLLSGIRPFRKADDDTQELQQLVPEPVCLMIIFRRLFN